MSKDLTEFEEDCLHYHGKVLTGKFAHWCGDFDELPIDETMGEIEACTCLSNEQRREVERLREKENARHNHLPMG